MATEILTARELSAGYGQIPVLHGINLSVRVGEVVVLLGSNGAGKTTTLKTLAGAIKPSAGIVSLDGKPITLPVHRRAALGVRTIPEHRAIFPSMNVAENLGIGLAADPTRASELFPELKPLLRRRAGLLSGGEQQMLVVARALSCRPRLLLADEVSLGLAPLIVQRLLTAIRRAATDEGLAVLLVEQHLREALAVADRGYVLQRGQIVMEGSGPQLRARIGEIESAYLSIATSNRLH